MCLFLVDTSELCQFCLNQLELNSCCSAQCVLCRRQSAHQVLVVGVPSLVFSSSCAQDSVLMTRDMLRILAEEKLMCSSRPTGFFCFAFLICSLLKTFSKSTTSHTTTPTTQLRPTAQPNTPPHNTEPPNHRTTQPRPNRPTLQYRPEGVAGRPSEGREDEIPPKGRGSQLPTGKGGGGEPPADGEEGANAQPEEVECAPPP